MLVKGEIQTIDFESNSCTVRMPIFETVSGGTKAIATAIFAITPGIFDSYKEGDIVIVGFERDLVDNPYIVGKLYTGLNTEARDKYRGSINCETLSVKNAATLPTSTKLVDYQDLLNTTDGNTSKTRTVADIIASVNLNNTEISGIKTAMDTLQANKISLIPDTDVDTQIGTWIDGKPFYRHIYTKYVNIAAGQVWGEDGSYFIDMSDLNFDNVWINQTYTIQVGDSYSLNQYNAKNIIDGSTRIDYWNTYINTEEKRLYYQGVAKDNIKKFIIVVEYTQQNN